MEVFIKKSITFKYAIRNNGSNVNGTKYKRAGCAALKISEETVAVRSPEKRINFKFIQNI